LTCSGRIPNGDDPSTAIPFPLAFFIVLSFVDWIRDSHFCRPPPVDDRGAAAIDNLKNTGNQVVKFNFDASKHAITLDGASSNIQGLRKIVAAHKKIALDATTLGLGEVLQVLRCLAPTGCKTIDLLYVEPVSYQHQHAPNHQLAQEFSLTNNCKFSAVQGFAHEYFADHPSSHVFMLGFEPSRILSAIEQRNLEDISRTSFHMIVGVPAFRPGWESNSIRAHLEVMENLQLNESNVRYCQANSVREAYLTLWDLYRTLGDDQGCFFVSPLGTKPHALGAALFLLETKGFDNPTSLYYDHPSRLPKRSENIGTWHHIEVAIGT